MTGVRVEDLPGDYDPAAVGKAIENAVRDIEANGVLATPSPGPAGILSFPGYDQVRRLALGYQNLAGGTYAGETDPRITYVRTARGDGISDSFYGQRFRFEVGTRVVPFLKFPTERGDNGAQDFQVGFGLFVIGIPHSLGRLPEFILARSSATDRGPAGQALTITGGTATTLGSGFDLAEPVRAQLDFVPILGVTRDDIERKIHFLAHFQAGASATGRFDWSDGGLSDFELPKLQDRVLAEMVTTDRTFSGLLLVTTWGLGTFRGGWSEWTGAALQVDVITHRLADTIQGQPESMVGCFVDGVGRSLWSMRVPRAAGTLQAIYADGLALTLTAGSVDFVMG